MALSRYFRTLDYGVWKAFAGGSARVPAAGDLVYYFPEGHAEHAIAPPNLSSVLHGEKFFFLCRVRSVYLLVHPGSDEVYARILLDPNENAFNAPPTRPEESGKRENFMSFSKVLTPSDANNGGGFSVPRFCADSIFPKLDYKAEPPVQSISAQDVHGNTWVFRHVYRGTPRRHLLTTGWSRFVSNKKLVAGDSVVFCRSPIGKLFVGVRRIGRQCGGSINFHFSLETKLRYNNGFFDDREGFLRSTNFGISSESVVEAVKSAKICRPFEVLYFPKIGWPEFVVAKDVVEAAMAVPWGPGARVKMAIDTEEPLRTAWYHGTICCNGNKEFNRESLWRMLQVNWDEPEVLQNIKAVNPWQVELVPSTSSNPVMKRLKLMDTNRLSSEGQGHMILVTGFGNTEIRGLTSSQLNLNESPFGTQGARHNLSSFSTDFVPESTKQICTNNAGGINAWNSVITRSTSPEDGSNVDQPGMEFCITDACKPTKLSKGTIQLFGKIIHSTETNVSTDFSVSFPHKLLLETRSRPPAVGACK